MAAAWVCLRIVRSALRIVFILCRKDGAWIGVNTSSCDTRNEVQQFVYLEAC